MKLVVKPMLAGKADLAKLQYPVMASPKLDGALAVNGELISRRIKAIPNRFVQSAVNWSEFHGLDGELIVGKPHADDAYRATLSGVMSRDGEPRTTFWIFDSFTAEGGFHRRFRSLQRLDNHRPVKGFRFRLVEHKIIEHQDDLLAYEEHLLVAGYEGVMIRSPSGPYKHGRSSTNEGYLLKLKRHEDGEALILAIDEQQRNENEATINVFGGIKRSGHKANKVPKGTTGSLKVRDLKTGVEFDIGTGMDDATRAEFWANPPIGKIAKYKYQSVGVKDRPRFPVFLGLRSPEDM